MTTLQIYQNYRIIPNLQLHMYRVAAVGQVILDNWHGPQVNQDIIIKTLLLHDMGNIIKFKLNSSLPRLNYWLKVQQDFIKKYGPDEHAATVKIAQELGMNKQIVYLLGHRGSEHLSQVTNSTNWTLKLSSYPDFRVAPNGVVTVNQRFKDIIKRYKKQTHPRLSKTNFIKAAHRACLKLEQQLQPHISINLKNITNQAIKPYLKALPNYKIV